jgi:hypothetical protein
VPPPTETIFKPETVCPIVRKRFAIPYRLLIDKIETKPC